MTSKLIGDNHVDKDDRGTMTKVFLKLEDAFKAIHLPLAARSLPQTLASSFLKKCFFFNLAMSGLGCGMQVL